MVRRGKRDWSSRVTVPWEIYMVNRGIKELKMIIMVPETACSVFIDGTPFSESIKSSSDFFDLGGGLYECEETGERCFILEEPWSGARYDSVTMTKTYCIGNMVRV
jgi:hypothetical protein